MRIYTRTGDSGETALRGGRRVRKSDPRIEAYGEIDELNALIGHLRGILSDDAVDELLESIQSDLMSAGAELALPGGSEPSAESIQDVQVVRLEAAIDSMENALVPLKQFILPTGCEAATRAHIARAVCRRAERAVARLLEIEPTETQILRYLNRLSDLLFVLSRWANQAEGVSDRVWTAPGSSSEKRGKREPDSRS